MFWSTASGPPAEAGATGRVEVTGVLDIFIVARNPEADSSLPYLVHVPIDGGVWLKARETWPRASRVYCHPADAVDVARLVVLERIAVLNCERRGPVVDLLLDRAQNRRAQFVFTQARGRPMIFWQKRIRSCCGAAFVDGAWLGLVARLQVRYPSVRIVFVETRALGERPTFDFFCAAAAEREERIDPAAAPLVLEVPALKRRRREAAKFAPKTEPTSFRSEESVGDDGIEPPTITL